MKPLPSFVKALVRSLPTAALVCLTVPARALEPQPPRPDPGGAQLKLVTTLGVLADLTRQVGGQWVQVDALARANQDPHYVEPTPVLMQRVRDADALVEVGLDLELWAEKVAAGSGNTRVQPGQPGRVIASKGVVALELPEVLSREWGDVHPYGNPHVWLDPLNARIIAGNIATVLADLDPEHASDYEANLAAFEKRIDESLFGAELVAKVGGKQLGRLAKSGRLQEYLEHRELTDLLGGWIAKAAPLKGRPVVTYHKTFIYLADRFGFHVPVEIEEKPGIPPSARHRNEVLELIQKQGVRTILEPPYYDRAAADYLSERSGARVVVAGIDVGETVGVKDYFDMIDQLLDALVRSETAAD